MVPTETLCCFLSTFSANTTGQLDILRHDSDTLSVDSTQVSVLKESNQVGLSGLLQSQDGSGLESKIGLEILGNFANETLERSLTDQEIGRLLVLADLTKSDGSGTVTVGLLDTSGSGGGLAGSLGGKLLTGSLSSGGLAGGLS